MLISPILFLFKKIKSTKIYKKFNVKEVNIVLVEFSFVGFSFLYDTLKFDE